MSNLSPRTSNHTHQYSNFQKQPDDEINDIANNIQENDFTSSTLASKRKKKKLQYKDELQKHNHSRKFLNYGGLNSVENEENQHQIENDLIFISELLIKDSSENQNENDHIDEKNLNENFSQIINEDEDDEILITGYTRSILKTIICWTFIIITFGLLRLILFWFNHWYLLVTHKKINLENCDKILIREDYQKKHKQYYVKNVIKLNYDLIKKSYEKNNLKLIKQYPYGLNDSLNFFKCCEREFYISMHVSGGSFRNADQLILFHYKQLRYLWNEENKKFEKLNGLDLEISSQYLHQQAKNSQKLGLKKSEKIARRIIYGINEIAIPIKNIFQLLFLEILNPFYVFQIFSVCLWISYNYYYYAIVIVIMSVYGITMSIVQTRKNQRALCKTLQNNDFVLVQNENGTERIETRYLVPGDLIEIPSNGCLMHCDAVLLSGNCILDESILTGESVPVTKTPLPMKQGLIFDKKEHTRHTLFCGTKVMQTRYIGREKVLAIVINTGYQTAKGELIRSIIYPPPVDYKFERDSYKFIAFLGLIAGVGFVYTLVSKILRSVSAGKVAIEALDIITIVVPPALPAAMSIGGLNAQKRLKKNDIYCISPRSINVSGSIDCVCFDKTGTLTEDGLDMWGVIPKTETNEFQMPLREIERLPMDSSLLYGMLTCHSITIMNGEMRGDPLDLKMFESTGWVIEEPANVSDDNKYDLLFPTIIRKPNKNPGSGIENLNKAESTTSLNSPDPQLGVVREFPFTSSLQRMSVITRRLTDSHFNVYCKGSPEMIHTLCRKETIPNTYFQQLNQYAQQGYRIIALACKSLTNRKVHTYTKLQRIERSKIECDLEFLGFVILENRLKACTTEVIEELLSADIRCVMVTGDNILTALSVAKDCGLIELKQHVIVVNAKFNETLKTYELVYNLMAGGNGTTTSNQNGISNENESNCDIMSTTESITSIETCTTLTEQRDLESGNNIAQNLAGSLCDTNRTPIRGKHFNYNYRFAMIGKTWHIIREEFPDLLPLFVTRGTIFARMSPDQKQALIQELQGLGYYVAMCGDGANDCGALKAAHTGISLSEAESSVASPFTSKNQTVKCIPNVIREGRAALVTSFGIFKYMAAYSMVQFVSVLILYSIDSNLTDAQFLYIDLFLISVFAFCFGRTEATTKKLVKEAPLNSLISIIPIASILLQLFAAIVIQIVGWIHLHQQIWFRPFNLTVSFDNSNFYTTNLNSTEKSLLETKQVEPDTDVENLSCFENYTIFVISSFQYIILAIVFSKGSPYRKTIISNWPFVVTILINLCIILYLAVEPHKFLINIFQLVMPNEIDFRLYLVAYGLINFILALFIEFIVIDYLLYRFIKYSKFSKFLSKNQKKQKLYLSYESNMRDNLHWPKITEIDVCDLTTGPPELNQSPKSYAELSIEQSNNILVPECSLLNSFFGKDGVSDTNFVPTTNGLPEQTKSIELDKFEDQNDNSESSDDDEMFIETFPGSKTSISTSTSDYESAQNKSLNSVKDNSNEANCEILFHQNTDKLSLSSTSENENTFSDKSEYENKSFPQYNDNNNSTTAKKPTSDFNLIYNQDPYEFQLNFINGTYANENSNLNKNYDANS